MQMSISCVQSEKSSLSHNNREHISGNEDINKSKIKDNITYIKEDIEEVYHQLFDEAIQEYNAKQKRSDRKIKDYYRKILNDSKTHHQREVIFAIGTAKENSDPAIWNMKKQILDEFMQSFEKRNPNLKVYNAVMHLDEANPHLHINYIPHFESKRGLKKRVGFDKAVQQQGLKDFAEWREREVSVIEQKLRERGIERLKKGSRAKFTVQEYKDLMEEQKSLKNENKVLKTEIEQHKELVADIKIAKTMPDVAPNEQPKTFFKRVNLQDYEKLKHQALKHYLSETTLKEQLNQVQDQNKKLKQENKDLSNHMNFLYDQIRDQRSQIDELEEEKKILEYFIRGKGLWKQFQVAKDYIQEFISFPHLKEKTKELYHAIQSAFKQLGLKLQYKDELIEKLPTEEELENGKQKNRDDDGLSL